MYIVIVGSGNVGVFLARTLLSRDHDIVMVEKNPKRAQIVAEELDRVLLIKGDGCDPHVLENAHIEKAKVCVAVTGDDEDNLIISQIAKDTFKVPRSIARVNNPKNEGTFRALGIDAISSTTIIAKLIEEETSVGELITLLSLKRGQITIVEMTLKSESPATGKAIKDLKLPKDSILASIVREDQVIFPKGETILYPGDSVIALTTPEKEKEIKKLFLI